MSEFGDMGVETINAFNDAIIEEFRANDGRLGGAFKGAPMLLLTTTGARSGRERTTPLAYTTDGDDLVVIASMGGAPKHPAWFHNLVANPGVTVEVGADTFAAHAVAVEGDERDRLYAQMAAILPNFTEYQQKTSRRIPVVVLTRVG
jgi:deazaflavin-dependent oxidoreductase (nitroreductase family)